MDQRNKEIKAFIFFYFSPNIPFEEKNQNGKQTTSSNLVKPKGFNLTKKLFNQDSSKFLSVHSFMEWLHSALNNNKYLTGPNLQKRNIVKPR